MDKTLRNEWVAALRSGEYKQGDGVLYRDDEDSFCCLGVLCDVLQKRGDIDGERGNWEYSGGWDEPRSMGDVDIPRPLREQIGLSYEIMDELITMNDGGDDWPEPQSFNKIADYIEKKL